MSGVAPPPVLNDADRARYQTYLSDAEDAYHALVTGAQLAMIRHGDREMQYGKTQLPQLFAYINRLRFMLGLELWVMPRSSARVFVFGG